MRRVRFKIGQTVKTTRFIPGYPVGIPTEAWVEIVETFKKGERFRVKTSSGNLYWVDADGLEALG